MDNDNIFEYVNSHSKILDIVSYFLGANKIIKKGNSYKTVCPFHQDHDPSLSIDVKKNICKCFVCGKGGSPITFTSEFLHISKIDALKKVAEICNIDLPDNFKVIKKNNPLEDKFSKELSALKELNKFYNVSLNLSEGKICKEYLTKRNIDEQTINDFSLGYAPNDSSLAIKSLVDRRFDLQTLQRAGILTNSVDNKDHFSSRLIFPLIDENNNIIAFAGRQLIKDDNTGKYVNYPETDLFHKSEFLYNLNNAKNNFSINSSIKCVYVVEGYMDAIALYKSGIKNVVACMTSTLSENQIKKLKKYNVQIRLLLDSDEPGQNGIERCLLPLLKEHIDTYVVRKFDLKNEGKDPDEVLDNKGKDYLIKCLNILFDPFIFIISRALKGNKTIDSTIDKKILLKKLLNYYPFIDRINKNKDIEILSKVTSIAKEDLFSYFNNDVEIKENTIGVKKETRKQKKLSYDEYHLKTIRDISKNIKIDDEHNTEIQVCNNLFKLSKTYLLDLNKSVNNKMISAESSILVKFANDYNAFNYSKSYTNENDEEFEFGFYPYYIVNLILNILYENKEIKKLDTDDYLNFIEKLYQLKNVNSEDNFNADNDKYLAIIQIFNQDNKLFNHVINILKLLSISIINTKTNLEDLSKAFNNDITKYQNDNSKVITSTIAKDGKSLDDKLKNLNDNKNKKM